MFKKIVGEMTDIFERKRGDYGQTTTDMMNKYGPLAMIIKLQDKMGRLENLLLNNRTTLVKDERVEDTLMDLANYAIITIIELEKQKSKLANADINSVNE